MQVHLVIVEGEPENEREVHYPELVIQTDAVPRKGERLKLMIDKRSPKYERPALPEEALFVVERVDWYAWLFDNVRTFADVILHRVGGKEAG